MTSVYHSGELEVQACAGVREAASRVGKSIRSAIPPAAQEFLRSQPMVIVGTVSASGRVWASLLTGQPGFMLAVDEYTVRIDAKAFQGDPLRENLYENSEIGMLVIDFATRRRMRVNGHAMVRSDGCIFVHARQVYANCPKYIQVRTIKTGPGQVSCAPSIRHTGALTEEQANWVKQVDTFFVASFHPESSADASHRGGNPGFVQVENSNALVWPDYAGNQMFQTLGNITVNPQAGLLFLDFEVGTTLQLTGKAQVIWDNDRVRAFAGAERLVYFHIEQVIEITGASPLRWRLVEYSPFNPA